MEKEETLQQIQEAYLYVTEKFQIDSVVDDLDQSSKNIRSRLTKVNKEIEDQDTFLSPKWTIISVLVLGIIFFGILDSVLNPYGRISSSTLYFLFGIVIFIGSFAGAWKIVQKVEQSILKSKTTDLNNKKKNLEQYNAGLSKFMNEATSIESRLEATIPSVVNSVPDNRRFVLAYYGELYEIIRTGQAKNLSEGIRLLEDRWRDKKEVTTSDNILPTNLLDSSLPDSIFYEIQTLENKVNKYLGK
ncbi:hypothetical protein NR996_01690 [Lactobacillus rodentium]|uniref:Uncharacterized protein n=1 Tax=Lactobacillus rodentium TaxID=947835 RepID=A0A2Z6TRR9_9LACO|nr:hypothetical protein [Lactobacillus rodentium]MCR1894124.1 hypothetical protein [Lactobacillus rodentium]GBG04419.1 hypothetical protein LrDSM24759_03330 [Lactobacillus rodentium]